MEEEQDLASRYTTAQNSAAGEVLSERPAEDNTFQLSGTDTVSGFAWNGQTTLVQDMKASIARGDVAAAKAVYDEITSTVDANADTLSDFTNMAGQNMGPVADKMAERSAYFLFGQYNHEKVVSPDGTETTIGQMLSNPAQFAADRSAELKRAGFNDSAAQLFMDNDPAASTIMDQIVRSKTAVPNLSSIRDFANVYANNYERVRDLFGEGTEQIVRDIVDQHRLSGSAVDTFDTIVDYATAYKEQSGKTGHALARDVFGGYKNLLAASFKGVEKFDSHGVAMPLQVTENQQRQFSAAFGPAVRETLKRLGPGVSFDLSDPRFRTAFVETQDCLAYVSAAAGDLFAESRRAGYDINGAFGKYIADAVTGAPPSPNNIVTAIRSLRDDLSNRLTGGHNLQRTAAELTGRSTDYITSMKQTTGFTSECPAADTIANDAHQYIVRTLLPYMAQGVQWGMALSKPAVQQKLVQGLAQRVGRSFFGSARPEAARAVAAAIVGNFATGNDVSVEDLIANLAYDPAAGGLSESARRTLRAWHRGNIASPLQFGAEKRQLMDRLLADGYNEATANTVISRVSEMAEHERRNGRNPKATWDTANAAGMYWEPEYQIDAKGNVVVDPRTRQPVVSGIRQSFGDRRRVSLLVNGTQYPAGTFQNNPAVWSTVQKALENEHNRRLQMEMFREKLEAKDQ